MQRKSPAAPVAAFAFVLLVAASAGAAPAAPPSIGQLRAGAGYFIDGTGVTYPASGFLRTPVVIVTASRSGRPIVAGTDGVNSTSFMVHLWDPVAKEIIGDGAGMDARWVGIVPGSVPGIAAGSVDVKDGDTVSFAGAFASAPVVVCNGWDPVKKALLVVGAAKVGPASFTLSVRALDGTRAAGRVSWIACAPGLSDWKEAVIQAGAVTLKNGGDVPFGPGYPQSPIGLVLSAVSASGAAAAGIGGQSDGGFGLVTLAPDGTDAGTVTLSWLGVCPK